uniref:Ig-like domain-containing protein n=1 Tax=Sphaeramia orbicularis TaxID=375764 RepID=A0A672YEK2_9TELE
MLDLDYWMVYLHLLVVLTGKEQDSVEFRPTQLFVPSGVDCEELSPVKNQESSLGGHAVTLTYKYSKTVSSANSFFWYRQYPGKPPELLISHSPSGSTITENVSGLKINVEKNLISMSISSAAVSDSAVYYCALQPTVTGNRNSKTEQKPLEQRQHSTTQHPLEGLTH